MAKYYGAIGFGEIVTGRLGESKEEIVEKKYFGDTFNDSTKSEPSDSVNDNYSVKSRISLIADTYITDRIYNIRYVTYMGVKWKAASINVVPPRVTIHLGGVYNG